MRLSKATVKVASFVVLGAMLAACSSSPQGVGSLPSGSSSLTQSSHMDRGNMPHGPMELLKQQAEGKIAGPVPRARLREQLKQLEQHPKLHIPVRHDGKKVAEWVTNTNYSYLLGMTKNAKANVVATNTQSNGCYYPVTVKVDHNGHAWVACEYNSSFEGGAAQEYSSNGTLMSSYNAGPPGGCSGSCYFDGYGFDQGENSSIVVDELSYYFAESCNPSCTYSSGNGFEYWPVGSPSSSPTIINTSVYGIETVYYMDVDSSNNIYFDYFGCQNVYPYTCGYGLAEIQDATGSQTFVSILPEGSLGFAGGVYVGGGGSTLSVTDQDARTIAQYSLPGLTAGAVLGPTLENAFGCGDPVSGGYNKTDTQQADGDACGWVDQGVVASNKWKATAGIDFTGGPEGAAFTPSDK